jgi:hypothetical protein
VNGHEATPMAAPGKGTLKAGRNHADRHILIFLAVLCRLPGMPHVFLSTARRLADRRFLIALENKEIFDSLLCTVL